MAVTYFLPAVYKSADLNYDIPNTAVEEKVSLDALDIPGFRSSDVGNLLAVGSDGKLLMTAEVDCVFNMEDILSADAGNIISISINDGKLYAGECILNVSDWLSTDANNGLGLGNDGKFWFDDTLDCEINISKLLSQEQGNAIKLSLVDGKLVAYLEEADCEINIDKLRSADPDNMLTVNTADGLLYVRPYDCQFNYSDLVSANTWNRLRLESEAGGDGKFLVLSEEQVSDITNNRLKTYTAGDHKFYVIPVDLLSANARSGLMIGTDGNIKTYAPDFISAESRPGLETDTADKLKVRITDLISTDSSNGITSGSDGKLAIDWSVFKASLFGEGNFQLVQSNRLPVGGTWAYIMTVNKTDGDVEGDHFIAHFVKIGIGAGGTITDTDGVLRSWGGDPGRQMIVWRVA